MNKRAGWSRIMVVGLMLGVWTGLRLPVVAADVPGNKPDDKTAAQSSQESTPQPASSTASQDTKKPEEGTVQQSSAPEGKQPSEPPAESASQPSAPPAAAEGTAASPSGLISVDFKDADIRQVLRIISLKSGVDIVASPDVEGLVTIKLTNVPWEQALDVILRTYGFAYERKGNIVRVLTLAAVEQEALATEVFPLSYSTAKEVADIVKEMLTDRGKVKFDERTNTIIVTDLPSNLFQLKSVVERLDRQTPQVLIESKIIDAQLKKDDNLGVDWLHSTTVTVTPATTQTTFPFREAATLGSLGQLFFPKPGAFSPSTGASISKGLVPDNGGTFTFGTIAPAAFTMTLNMLKSRGNTHIISNPTIMTLNNKEASVQVGDDINIPNFQIDPSTGRATVTGFQTRSTGVILKVTPHVNPQEEIVLDFKPEITSVGSFDEFASGVKFPRFSVQKAQTQVRLRDGDTLVIGGLVKRQRVVSDSRVPILGDIPVLGWLFTTHEEKEDPHQDLLIFLTVKLIKEMARPQAAMAAAQPASE